MEMNQFIKATVGVVVVLIVIVSVAVPILSNLSLGDTYTNDGTGLRYIQGGDHTIEVSSGTTTIDGQAIPSSDGPRIYAFGPGFMILGGYTGVQINRGFTLEFEVLSSSNPGAVHITDDEVTISLDSGSSKLFSFNGSAYFVDPTGESNLGLIPMRTSMDDFQMVVKSGTEVIALWDPSISSGYAKIIGKEAEIVDMGVNSDSRFSGSVTKMNVGLAYSESDGLATYGPGDLVIWIQSSGRAAGGYIIAPIEFEMISEDQELFNSVVAVIPLILTIGLIIAAVAAFITLKSRGGGA